MSMTHLRSTGGSVLVCGVTTWPGKPFQEKEAGGNQICSSAATWIAAVLHQMKTPWMSRAPVYPHFHNIQPDIFGAFVNFWAPH